MISEQPSAQDRSGRILEELSGEDRAALIALPYRVGLFISQSDLRGGEAAAALEYEKLSAILTEISQDYCKSGLIQKVLGETCRKQNRRESWGGNLEEVPADCRHLIDSLSFLLEGNDLSSLKDTLMDVALAVAMAYRESGAGDKKLLQKTLTGIPGWVEKLRAGLFGTTAPVPPVFLHDSISVPERAALSALAEALGWGGRSGGQNTLASGAEEHVAI